MLIKVTILNSTLKLYITFGLSNNRNYCLNELSEDNNNNFTHVQYFRFAVSALRCVPYNIYIYIYIYIWVRIYIYGGFSP